MKRISAFVLALAWGVLASGCASHAAKPEAGQTQHAEQGKQEAMAVFRKPFKLHVYMDEQREFEATFDQPIPYVYDNEVYIFPGESFGLKLHVTNGKIDSVSYQKDKAGADIELDFRQMMEEGKLKGSMMLVLQSHLDKVVYMEALMSMPGRKGLYKSSILPLHPGKRNYESWPHPIVGLILGHLSLEKEGK